MDYLRWCMIEEVLLFGWWGSCWCIEVQPFAVLPSTFFFFFFGQVENIVPPSHIIYTKKLFKLYFWSGAGHFIYFVPFHLLYFFFLFKDAQIESENRICVLPSYGIWRDRSDGSNRLVQKCKRERERDPSSSSDRSNIYPLFASFSFPVSLVYFRYSEHRGRLYKQGGMGRKRKEK